MKIKESRETYLSNNRASPTPTANAHIENTMKTYLRLIKGYSIKLLKLKV